MYGIEPGGGGGCQISIIPELPLSSKMYNCVKNFLINEK